MAHLNREQKLAKLKLREGPGVFVYQGGAKDSTSTPTVLRYGRNVAKFDESGMPVMDRAGRQVFERVGQVVVDDTGKPKMGGPPKVEYTEIAKWKVGGVEFPKGEPVVVYDHQLALRLRTMDQFFSEEENAFEKIPQKAGGAGRAKRGVYKLRGEPLADALAKPASDSEVVAAVEDHEQKAKRGRPRKSDNE